MADYVCKGQSWDVLDHGRITLIDWMGADETVIESARMSTGKGFQGWESGMRCSVCGQREGEIVGTCGDGAHHIMEKVSGDMNLLDYLWRNGHSTPFEMCELHIEVQAPIMVFREWHRHRTFCLAGDTQLVFDLPGSEKRDYRNTQKYGLTIKEVYDRFQPTENASRPDKQLNPYFKKQRVQAMRLRCVNEQTLEPTYTSIVDVWESGKKLVYEVMVGSYGTIRCSADHRFFTPRGWKSLKEMFQLPTLISEEIYPGAYGHPMYMVKGEADVPVSCEIPAVETDEVWRPVLRWESYYEVSNMGRVRRIAGGQGMQAQGTCKKLTPAKSDYLVTSLNRPGIQETAYIHILVLEAFNSPKPDGLECRHLDNNKWNNWATNLCWGTSQENADDRVQAGSTKSLKTVEYIPTRIRCVGEEMTYDIEVAEPWHNFVAEGFVVHNSYNEFSARYAQMPNVHYLPEPGRIQKQDTKNKQGSAGAMDEDFAMDLIEVFDEQQNNIYQEYMRAIDQGVAKEVARLNTPVARYSKMRVKTDLLNWLKFLRLRMHPHAQFEIRQYANIIGNEIIGKIWPRVWSVFQEHTLYGTHFSRVEMGVIQRLLMSLENRIPDLNPEKTMAEEAGLKGSVLDEFLKKLHVGGQEIL